MPKFEVRLNSRTDEHSRVVTLSAHDEEEARAVCVLAERERVAYTLDDDPYIDDDEAAAIAELDVDDTGKPLGGDARSRGRLHMHLQRKPYVVSGIRVVPIDTARLVGELQRLQEDPELWEATIAQMRDAGLPLAAVTAAMFGIPVKNQYDGTAVVDWDTDTIKCALLNGYSLAQDTHDFYDDVSASEVAAGGGYTAGGVALTSKTATYDSATDQIRLDAADAAWAASTISATDAVVYKSTGTAATSPLIQAIDFGAAVASAAATFQITFDATGIVVIDVT